METSLEEASLVPAGTDLLAAGTEAAAEETAAVPVGADPYQQTQVASAPEPATAAVATDPPPQLARAVAGTGTSDEQPVNDWTTNRVEVTTESGVYQWTDILHWASRLGTNPRIGYADLLNTECEAKTEAEIRGTGARAVRARLLAARKGGISLSAVPPFVLTLIRALPLQREPRCAPSKAS